MLDMQNSSSATSCPFVIVLSDGKFNKENVRKYLRESKEKRYLYIFVVLDKTSQKMEIGTVDKNGQKDASSILNMRSAMKVPKGGVKLVPYL